MGSFKGHSTRDLRKARSQNIRNRNVFSFAFIVFSSCSYQTKVSKDHLLQESCVFEVDTYRQLHPHSCYADRCWILLTAAKLRRFEPAHARIDGYHVWSYISDCKWWSFTNLENPETTRRRRLPWLKFDQLLKIGIIFTKPRLVCPFCSSPVWIWSWISHSFPLFPIVSHSVLEPFYVQLVDFNI